MSQILTVAIIGCGGRGCRTYGRIMDTYFRDKYKITALCDINPAVLTFQAERLGIEKENAFPQEDVFFQKKRADVLVIATQDRDHCRMAVKAMELGYDILVEKPLTSDAEECRMLLAAQQKTGRKAMVCHVLRYAPAFTKVEQLLESGVIGKLVSVSILEQVHYVHFAHSYVRGNWRKEEETSPILLAKCCHDLDLLQHYAHSPCKTVSSVGELSWFKKENAPEGSAERCIDCQYLDSCPYSAKRIYLDNWKKNDRYVFSGIMTYPNPTNEEEILRGLREGKYGRCVYRCDNDVADHQMTAMVFENGVTAQLTLMAFTGRGGRIVRLFGTMGEIELHEEAGYVRLKPFGSDPQIWQISDLIQNEPNNHGGGDYMLLKDLYEVMIGQMQPPTAITESVESHLMGIAAEVSRHRGGQTVAVHEI